MTTPKPKRSPRASKPAQPAKRAASARGGQVAALMRLVELVERVAACQGGDTYFSKSELEGWPAELVQDLLRVKLLAQASPASSAECPGCEEACMMPVQVLPGPTAETSRALIVCETRDDISRVDVPISSLERLKSSGQMLADALAKLLHMELARPTQLDGVRWQFGSYVGANNKSLLTLSLDAEPRFAIAGHTIPLAELLNFKSGAVTLDQSALRKLVDNPTGLAVTESSTLDARAKYVYDRVNELKRKRAKNFLQIVAKELDVSDGTIKTDYKKHEKSIKGPLPASSIFALASQPPDYPKRKRKE